MLEFKNGLYTLLLLFPNDIEELLVLILSLVWVINGLRELLLGVPWFCELINGFVFEL